MKSVILQPAPFMDVWLSEAVGWNLRRGRAVIAGKGDRPAS